MPDLGSGESPTPAERPVEQVVITFFDLPCLAVRATNGSIYLALRDLSDAVGVQLSAQLRRIRAHTTAKGVTLVSRDDSGRLPGSGVPAPTDHCHLAPDDQQRPDIAHHHHRQ